MDQGNSTGSQAAEKVTPAAVNVLDDLADSIKKSVVEVCAKVAEIHHVKPVGGFIRGSYMDGYNTAVSDIAAKIREL